MRGDTSAVARYARLWESSAVVLVNEIVVCELFAGLRDHERAAGEALIRYLEFVQPGPEAAIQAGRWRHEARRSGRTLSLADALIAVAAHEADATVLTRNLRDFSHLPVTVEAY